uniref:ribonuclease H n=1 Tax=Xiphophorus maculatus TaxID=8083 RepID=A0A3B5PZW3_XIPMA
MASRSRVVLENAYWEGDEIYAKVEGVPYLVDTGAEVSMTRKDLKTAGHLKVQFANGKIEEMPYGTWKGVVWVKGPYNLLTVKDLDELSKKKSTHRRLERRLTSLKARLVKVGPTQTGSEKQDWYKPVDIPTVTEQKLEESDFSPAGKEKLREIIATAQVARFKNDCGDLGPKFVHHIEGGVHPPVRQYPLNPGAVEEMDKIVKELGALEIIREELNPITNSPIQAVKKPESAGGGWRPVINFKALNRRTIANRASLINPQGALKTLRVKKFKSCIDLANGFFSLRLARQSQGKTAFTHKGKSYVWQRLPQGYKNSPNVFQSAVMEVLGDVGATVYIDDLLKTTLQKLTNVSPKEFLRALMTPVGGKPTHRHVVTSGKLGTLFTPPGGTTALILTKHLLLSGLCGPGMKITLEIGNTSGGDSNKMSSKLG